MTAELKLAAQQDLFPASFKQEESGRREITKETILEHAENETEEMVVSQEGQEEKTGRVNKKLPEEFKRSLHELFEEYREVFAWDHTELKGIDPRICQHRIPLKMDARPIRMQRYRMNPNYAAKVKEEIDALLNCPN